MKEVRWGIGRVVVELRGKEGLFGVKVEKRGSVTGEGNCRVKF